MGKRYTQESRPIAVSTTLAPDELLFYRMTAAESLGRLFTFDLELLSENFQIKIEDLLGTSMAIECPTQNEGTRCFHGCVTSFSQVGIIHNLCRYQATLRPWLWFLTRTADCRIFQNMTAPDIIKQIFGDHGFSDYSDQLSGSFKEREYCVQYRETDFNFVSRLMEEEGIYYYFEHAQGKHTLVLSDSEGAHGPFADYGEIPYYPPDEHTDKPDHINGWKVSGEVQSGKYTLRDFDYLKPKTDLETKASATRSHDRADMEVYDYPGLYEKPDDGDTFVRSRLEELQAAGTVAEGAGAVRGIATGSLFELSGYPREDQNLKYLVTSSTYKLVNDEYQTRFGLDAELPCHCRFTAIESKTPYRSPRITRKPFVQGPQTAIVVGKAGEEIWTEEHGRVKVQFHWDREGKFDENSSCWIRVSSLWAGTAWGAVQLPRIGQEVIVDFLEGDPDRPIITGRVYNGDNKPALKLPADKTQSTIKSRSTKSGNEKTFNELRFEDKKDGEEVYFHAERDFNRVVENNDTLKVGFDKKEDGDQTIEIQNNQKLVVGNAQSKDGSQTVEIWKDQTLTIQTGDQTVKIAIGKSTTEAAVSIELKVGASSLKVEPAKITLKSPQIAIQGDAMVEVSAPMTKVTGSAVLALQGGIIKIN
jgi:type VI secretion system secreted protein VgrG